MKIKRNWSYFFTLLKAIFVITFATASSIRKRLKNKITNLVGNNVHVSLFKSARSSIHAILLNLKQDYKDIFIPYRLCNVVEVAAQEADLKIIYYKDSEDFLNKIDRRLKKSTPILLVATYYNKDIDNDKIVGDFLNHFGVNAPVIFDESQSIFDFSLYEKYFDLSDKFLVLSFNDKFIPGVMGAAVISKIPINFHQEILSVYNELFYFAVLLKNMIDFIKPVRDSEIKGEFSLCKGVRYDILPHEISKTSSVLALLYLRNIEKISSHFYKNNNELNKYFNKQVVKPPIYYLISHIHPIKTLLKGPYLLFKNEPLSEAVKETGGIFIINTYKYKFENEE